MTRQEIEQKILKFLNASYTEQEYQNFKEEMQSISAGPLFTQIEWSFNQMCLARSE